MAHAIVVRAFFSVPSVADLNAGCPRAHLGFRPIRLCCVIQEATHSDGAPGKFLRRTTPCGVGRAS